MKSKVKLISLLLLVMMVFATGCQNYIGSEQSADRDTIQASNNLSRGTSSLDSKKPIGFGKSATGGGSGKSTTVTSFSALESALNNSSIKVVKVSGTIKMKSRLTLKDLKDKSLIGINKARLVSTDMSKSNSGIFYIKNSKNLIIQNITFEGPGAYDTDGYDSLCLDNCQTVWVDHCDFQDGMDGNFDIKNQSNNITVSWCIFQYKKSPKKGGPGGADDHRYSNLIGSSDSATSDAGKLKITFQYCRWGQGCRERMPRIRYGQVHILNCLFDSSVSNHCIRVAHKASALVEGNYFDNQKKPIDLYKNYTAVKAVKNSGCKDMSEGSIFKPSYSYSVTDASKASSEVKKYAGATL